MVFCSGYKLVFYHLPRHTAVSESNPTGCFQSRIKNMQTWYSAKPQLDSSHNKPCCALHVIWSSASASEFLATQVHVPNAGVCSLYLALFPDCRESCWMSGKYADSLRTVLGCIWAKVNVDKQYIDYLHSWFSNHTQAYCTNRCTQLHLSFTTMTVKRNLICGMQYIQ